MRKTLTILLTLLLCSTAYAQPFSRPLIVEEQDGAPTVYNPYKLKVENGSLTDNADGTVTIDETDPDFAAMDTEAELEAQLTDVSNIITNNDSPSGDLSGSYPNPDVTDDSHAHTSTTLTLDTLIDADSDTKIQVEESADEDIIRFDTGGTERWIIDASGHLVPTTDNAYNFGAAGKEAKTLFLNNSGGNAIEFPSAIGTGAPTSYTVDVGGGSAITASTEGGTFKFLFDGIGAISTSKNSFVIDFGSGSLASSSNLTISGQTPGFADVDFVIDFGSTITFSLTSVAALGVQFNNSTGGKLSFATTTGSQQFFGAVGAFYDINTNYDNADVIIKGGGGGGAGERTNLIRTDASAFSNFGNVIIGRQGINTTSQPAAIESGFLIVDAPGTTTSNNPLPLSGSNFGKLLVDNTTQVEQSGNMTTIANIWIDEPNINLNGNTLTNAVTLYIENAPDEGTNDYALWVDAGKTQLDGDVDISGDLVFDGGDGTGMAFGSIYYGGAGFDTALAAQDTDYQVLGFDTNGVSNNTTPDHTNDHITVTNAGIYLIHYSISSRSATSNNFEFEVKYNNGATDLANCHTNRVTTTAGRLGVSSVSCMGDIPASATLEVWVRRTDGGAVSKTITIEHITFNALQIGGT